MPFCFEIRRKKVKNQEVKPSSLPSFQCFSLCHGLQLMRGLGRLAGLSRRIHSQPLQLSLRPPSFRWRAWSAKVASSLLSRWPWICKSALQKDSTMFQFGKAWKVFMRQKPASSQMFKSLIELWGGMRKFKAIVMHQICGLDGRKQCCRLSEDEWMPNVVMPRALSHLGQKIVHVLYKLHRHCILRQNDPAASPSGVWLAKWSKKSEGYMDRKRGA